MKEEIERVIVKGAPAIVTRSRHAPTAEGL